MICPVSSYPRAAFIQCVAAWRKRALLKLCRPRRISCAGVIDDVLEPPNNSSAIPLAGQVKLLKASTPRLSIVNGDDRVRGPAEPVAPWLRFMPRRVTILRIVGMTSSLGNQHPCHDSISCAIV